MKISIAHPKIKHPSAPSEVSDQVLARVTLECCGGGYTEGSVAEAMLTQQQLKEGVTVTTSTGYIITPYLFEFAPGQRVITEHGPGAIVQKDMCRVNVADPDSREEWCGRWIVLHDVLPPNRPWMKAGEMLAYWPKELRAE